MISLHCHMGFNGNHYEKAIIFYGSSPVTDTITEMGVAHTSRPIC